MYAIKARVPEENYFAFVRTANGGSAWEHVRTNRGRKVAYAMIAKHWEGEGKIESFRDQRSATDEDRANARQSDGILRRNIWAGHEDAPSQF